MRWILHCGLLSLLIIMAVLGLMPVKELLEKYSEFPLRSLIVAVAEHDKLMHFVTFYLACIFTHVLTLKYHNNNENDADLKNIFFKRLFIVTIAWIVISAGSEAVQSLLPYREWDTEDVLANMVGVSAASLSIYIYQIVILVLKDGDRWWRIQQHRRIADLELQEPFAAANVELE